jgi:exosome complex component CSL4
MSIEERKSGTFVSPGDPVGVIEEFLQGQGVYEDDGTLFALTTGHLVVDLKQREIAVRRTVRTPLIPKRGDIVQGTVRSVQDRTMMMKILQIDGTPLKTPFTGVMHVSDVSRGYVKTMRDAFKPGDVIQARVISTVNREHHLSTQGEGMGVISAVCSRCGGELEGQGNRFRCTLCNRIERRKMPSEPDDSRYVRRRGRVR